MPLHGFDAVGRFHHLGQTTAARIHGSTTSGRPPLPYLPLLHAMSDRDSIAAPPKAKAIQLWSCPRNLSTALMYAFAQRADTEVLDEPLYAHFLRCSGATRPDREATLAGCDADGPRVLREQILAAPNPERPFRFCKHIVNQWTHPQVALPDALLPTMGAHILFIRDPRRIVASYAKLVEAPGLEDVALPEVEAMQQKLQTLGLPTLILEAGDLLEDPPAMLQALCRALDIPYDAAMLRWPKGPRPEDGPWAPWWYRGLHSSTGFRAPEQALPHLSTSLAALADACMPAYQRLYRQRLRP